MNGVFSKCLFNLFALEFFRQIDLMSSLWYFAHDCLEGNIIAGMQGYGQLIASLSQFDSFFTAFFFVGGFLILLLHGYLISFALIYSIIKKVIWEKKKTTFQLTKSTRNRKRIKLRHNPR